ncbi:S24 family peptidase [Sphingobium sp. AN558]|uniref:S24 family peptidase n=1 Tax=Sphingobium sp. AN558 TaxID=3133442 RepID=UPI0030C4E001
MAKERARRLLDELITQRGNSYADISRLIGRNAAYIQQFIKRGTPRKLDEQDREIIARYFGISEHLLRGVSSVDEPASSPPRAPKIIRVPRLALGVSAGAGTLDEDERPAGALAFDAQWLRGLSPHPSDLSIVQVEGESMAPTLADGDEIMVDPHDDAARLRDGIYVLRLDGVLMVKRIAIGPRRNKFSVLSDNPHYPDWSDIEPELVEILGRVVWTGRALQ